MLIILVFSYTVVAVSGGITTADSVKAALTKDDSAAITRLHEKTRDVVDQIWLNIRDPQRYAIIKEKGAVSEILRMFGLLKGDMFAMDSLVQRSRIETKLKTLTMSNHEWRKAWESVTKLTGKVKLLFSHLDQHISAAPDRGLGTEPVALEDYAHSILQPGSTQDTAMLATMSKLNHLFSFSKSDGKKRGKKSKKDVLYKLRLALNSKNGSNLCAMRQSPHQLMYNLYNVIALTEIKGYTMIQFSYMVLKLYRRQNFTLETDLARKRFEQQAMDKLLAVKDVLSSMSRDYWRCDSLQKSSTEGITYVQLTKLLQGHIENEVDMSDASHCRDSCRNYDVAEAKGCFSNLFCAKQAVCHGRIFDCQFYHADSWVCLSDKPHRKYDWIEYEDGRVLGKKDGHEQCTNKIKVDSWWRWLFYHCSYCLCKCDAPGPESDRFWSLREAVAETDKNFIVTGVRFAKRGRVINLEIEQARALPEGSVDEATRAWFQTPEIKVSNNSKEEEEEPQQQATTPDYMTMTYEQRAIDIDRIMAPDGHVITGIRMRNLGGHLNMEVQVTPITFRGGKLVTELSHWVGNDNTPATANKRKEIMIVNPDIPTKFNGQSTIDTHTNQFITFDVTSAEKDVMQTIVPFIDIQDVRPDPGTWLSGINLYHKGHLGYGGYIGLSVTTYDFSTHLMPKRHSKTMKQDLRYNF